MAIAAGTALPKLKYFDLSGFGGLSGRGGVIRFYLLSNDIRFEEETVNWNDWSSQLKAEAIKSGECPSGHLPVLHMNGKNLIEHLAILRLLAKESGTYGKDAMQDYEVDSLADAASEFRAAMLKSAFGSPEDKRAYTSSPDQRPHFYKLMNTLLERSGATGHYAVGSSSSFADAVLFAVLWDDICVHGEDQELTANNPKVASFYRAFLSLEPILAWCKSSRSDLCDTADQTAGHHM